jgi:phosphatidylinositol dimannoside acyltransferase
VPIEPVSAAYRTGALVARRLPKPAIDALAATGSALATQVLPRRRMVVERNLRRVYGQDYSGSAMRRSVQATFRSYARYWVDSFRLPDLSVDALDAGLSFEGYDHLLEARANGPGPILVLPHLGGWEWAGFWFTEVMRVPVTVVVEPLEPPELFEFFAGFRRRLGMNIVALGPKAGGEVLRAIKEGHVLCLLADRDIHGDGVTVEFFGEPTTLPAGPATLALRTGAALLPTAVYFEPKGHHAIVEEPVPVERAGRLRDDVARVTQAVADRLAGLIRTAPEQWHLLQPNWPSDHEAIAAMGRGSSRPTLAGATPSP